MNGNIIRLLPNLITSLRIILSAALFAAEPSGTAFWTIYLFCGASDIADGFFARRFCAESLFGSRLDTAADIAFAAACAVKLLPLMKLSPVVLALAAAAAALKIAAAIIGKAKGRNTLFEHSAANKALGLTVFLLLPFFKQRYFCLCAGTACCFALFVAAHELIHNIKLK